MKQRPYLTLSFFLWLLFVAAPAFAFQVADGTRPSQAPVAKYIFYWGKYQCDLSEANAYKSRLTLSPAAFRQMMLSAPTLWNGTALVKNFHFQLEDISVSTADYTTHLAQLDSRLGSKLMIGNTLNITELVLSEGVTGAIYFLLEEEKEKPFSFFGNAPNQRNNYLNDFFLDNAVWGRDDIYETSNRDYFTVREFWQNIRQEPALEWKSYQKPTTLRTVVTFTSKDKASMGVKEILEEGAYPGLLANLENYRYMVHPGAMVTLELQSAKQYDLLYKKTMHIVADDDPRLRLRRKRDLHNFSLYWGNWSDKVPELYLTSFTNAQGESVPADLPIARGSSISLAGETVNNWGKSMPECRIDDEKVSGNMSFRVTIGDSIVFFVHSNDYPADSINAIFTQKDLVIDKLKFDNFQMEGYELPPMTFTLYIINMNPASLVRNEFDNLKKFAEIPSRARLFPPTFTDSEIVLRFELPEKSPVMLSIFDLNGGNSVTQDGTFLPGETTFRIQRSVFHNKGKYLAFLNSNFGVVKVEFVVE